MARSLVAMQLIDWKGGYRQCLDCRSNGHTNAAFYLIPDNRPEAARFRIDTVSLRGMFNNRIHGSKRSLRSVEDFSEFEQRTAYFDDDPAIATKKGSISPTGPARWPRWARCRTCSTSPAPKLTSVGFGMSAARLLTLR
jgi:hypothetical protein